MIDMMDDRLESKINAIIESSNWDMILSVKIDNDVLKIRHNDICDEDSSHTYLIELDSFRNKLVEFGYYLKAKRFDTGIVNEEYWLCTGATHSRVHDMEIEIQNLNAIITTLNKKKENDYKYDQLHDLTIKLNDRKMLVRNIKDMKKELKALDKDILKLAGLDD